MARLSRDSRQRRSGGRSRRSVARSSGSRSAIESSDGRRDNRKSTCTGAFQHHTIVLDHMAAPGSPTTLPSLMRQSSRLALPGRKRALRTDTVGSRHRYTRRPRVQRSFWSGVDRRALAATPSSSWWRWATGASPPLRRANVGLLKELGASEVLDHRSPSIVGRRD